MQGAALPRPYMRSSSLGLEWTRIVLNEQSPAPRAPTPFPVGVDCGHPVGQVIPKQTNVADVVVRRSIDQAKWCFEFTSPGTKITPEFGQGQDHSNLCRFESVRVPAEASATRRIVHGPGTQRAAICFGDESVLVAG